MKALLSLILILSSFSVHGQLNKITTYYSSPRKIHEIYTVDLKTGQKHGDYMQYKDKNAGLLSKGRFSQGLKVGTWITYVPFIDQNIVMLTASYNSKGQLHGKYNGKECLFGCPAIKGEYVNGKMNGKFEQYYTDNIKNIEYIAYFRNNMLNGKRTTFYKNGLIGRIENFRDGVPVDTGLFYIRSNLEPRLSEIVIFKDGEASKVIKPKTSIDFLYDKQNDIYSEYASSATADDLFKKWKYQVDLPNRNADTPDYLKEMLLSNENQQRILDRYRGELSPLPATNVLRADYEYIMDFIQESFSKKGNYIELYNPDIVISNKNVYRPFFYKNDATNAVYLICQISKLNGGLSRDDRAELCSEIAGEYGNYPFAVLGKNSILYEQIKSGNLPENNLNIKTFSNPLAVVWVLKKLIYYASLDSKITSSEEQLIREVVNANK